MTLRFEFVRSRSPNFKRALAIVRDLPGFSERGDGPDAVYSVTVEGNNHATALAVFDLVGKWRGTAFYMDGALVSKGHAMRTLYGAYFNEIAEARVRDRNFGTGPAEFVRLQRQLKPPPQ